ncbi:hypothetical protein FHL15_008213 [Xylaria flabelliformis]|uniref:Nephrocystin 3-like N-terminal domain-containing protein n=1 Tax=Xylaria flabelliformis TaxID=2512241 RepID=A0A553HST5_9PEZI|nr:hypothetical protein FHL15_008213 [Xylaria flabelliformis]
MLKGIRNKLRSRRPSPNKTNSATTSASHSVSQPVVPSATQSTAQSASVDKEQTRSERFGLFYVGGSPVDPKQDNQYPVDIIAVHGLNGDAYTTWTHPNGVMWIRDILPSFIPGCRVYTYGYPSQVAFSSSFATVQEFSRGLLSSEHRSIVFALVFAHLDNREYGSLLRSVIGITFLGTPHRGSEIANLGKTIGTIINICSKTTSAGTHPGIIRTDLLEHLNYDSNVLHELTLAARNRLENMTIVSFHETEPTPPLSVLIVDRTSAIMGIVHEDVIPLYANHRDIFIEFSDIEKSCMMLFNIFDVADYKRRLPKPIEGTCQWIRSHPLFVSWFDKAENALLWLTGHPGCGKTMLSYSVARQLEETSQNVLIYFCDDKISMQKDAQAVLIGLISQLVHRHRSMVRHVRRVFEVQGASILHSFSALWSIFEKIIKDLKSSPLYVIVDALDECEGSSCHDLLGAIHELVSASGPTTESSKYVKFLLTSRPTLGQTYVANQLIEHQLPIDDGQPGYGEDLQIFIQQKVEEIALKRRCSEETKSFLLKALLSRADQTFLWIHMVLASLERSVLASINDFRDIIAKLPPDLEAMYLNFLSAIPTRHQDSASQLLRLLFASSRPLLLDEINVAFTIKPTHYASEDVLRDCQPAIDHTILGILGPLVRVSESKVSLVHQTAKDFLLVEDGNEKASHIYDAYPDIPAITVERSALCMASACIYYLLLEDFSEDLYSLEQSPIESSSSSSGSYQDSPEAMSFGGFWDDNAPDLNADMLFCEPGTLDADISQALASKHAFFNYSALHWAEHFALCESSASNDLKKAAKPLLDVKTASCRNWLHFFWSEATSSPGEIQGASNPIILAAYFNLHETLVDLLESHDSSQLEKDQALFWGAKAGHSRVVATLLEAGANPDYHAVETQTALTISAAHGHIECVVQLLEKGRCNLNVKGKNGRTALSFAAGNGHHDIVKHLLSQDGCNADEGDNSGCTPLIWVAVGGHVPIVSTLAKHPGVDINHRDRTGRTVVVWAAIDGMEDVLKHLLKLRGVDANLQDNKGRTPLSWAAGNGHAGAARILLRSNKVEMDKADHDGRNPISWACGHGHEAALRVLLKYGCKGFDESDVDGWTPLAWAVHRDAPGVAEALIAAGVNDFEKGARTVLSWAVEYGHLSVVRVLLREGADPTSALDRIPLAQAMGRYDLVNELQLYMNRKSDVVG